MFHSFGTVQSSTGVPEGTSVRTSGAGSWRSMRARVSRTPSPVMLRQIGYSSSTSAYIRAPSSAGRSGIGELRVEIGIGGIALGDHGRARRPADREARVVPAWTARTLGHVARAYAGGPPRGG